MIRKLFQKFEYSDKRKHYIPFIIHPFPPRLCYSLFRFAQLYCPLFRTLKFSIFSNTRTFDLFEIKHIYIVIQSQVYYLAAATRKLWVWPLYFFSVFSFISFSDLKSLNPFLLESAERHGLFESIPKN